jgi:sigma-E factor negative regulatory protein RseA
MKIKNEHLSAVFDDEAGEFEQRRLLDELEKDAEMRQSWSNYALIGDVMRKPEKASIADPDFLSSIQLRLDEEDAYSNVMLATAKKSKVAWLRPVSGIAIAATVAAISVFSMQTFMSSNNASETSVRVAYVSDSTTAPVIAKVASTSNPEATTVATKPSTNNTVVATTATAEIEPQGSNVALDERTKMQRYLASHIRNASRKTIAPTLRMISYNYH